MSAEGSSSTSLRALGFCGADDSVRPRLLALISRAYPLVEFGVLFRPDQTGQPRYASDAWVEELSACYKGSGMKLAAHLCGSRVNELLAGDDAFVRRVVDLGFQRIQVNATAVNGVDTSRLAESVPIFFRIVKAFPDTEFIIQKNEETRPLWEGLLQTEGPLPSNLSMLVDESKGTGVLSKSWPSPTDEYPIGYAGGIGPDNIRQVLTDVQTAGNGKAVWIDMESSLRSVKNDQDVFDIDKCFAVIEAVCEAGLMEHPSSNVRS